MGELRAWSDPSCGPAALHQVALSGGVVDRRPRQFWRTWLPAQVSLADFLPLGRITSGSPPDAPGGGPSRRICGDGRGAGILGIVGIRSSSLIEAVRRRGHRQLWLWGIALHAKRVVHHGAEER
jgi:hypothetical protein